MAEKKKIKVGTRKLFKSGRVGVWSGTGWKEVKPTMMEASEHAKRTRPAAAPPKGKAKEQAEGVAADATPTPTPTPSPTPAAAKTRKDFPAGAKGFTKWREYLKSQRRTE